MEPVLRIDQAIEKLADGGILLTYFQNYSDAHRILHNGTRFQIAGSTRKAIERRGDLQRTAMPQGVHASVAYTFSQKG